MDASAAIGIAQRRGLNKLRHRALDVFWVQEQRARRLLPLRKVPGPRNPSDMMTKNVDQSHIDMYLDILNLRLDIRRASVAQSLHLVVESIAKSESTSALLLEDLMPLRRCVKPDHVNAVVRSASSGYKSVGVLDPSSGRSKTHPSMSVG